MSGQKLEPFPAVGALFYLFKMNFLVRRQRIFRVGYEAAEITFMNLPCMNLYKYSVFFFISTIVHLTNLKLFYRGL